MIVCYKDKKQIKMITVNVIIQSVKCKVFIFLARFLTSITPAWSKIIEITQKSNYDLRSSSGEASAPAALRTEAKAAILPRIPLSKAAGTHTHTHKPLSQHWFGSEPPAGLYLLGTLSNSID